MTCMYNLKLPEAGDPNWEKRLIYLMNQYLSSNSRVIIAKT